MNKFLITIACLLVSTGAAMAQAVTIYVDAGQLRGPLGTNAEPSGGLLQLIASQSGTFSTPNSGSYVTGDNILLSSFAMNNNGGTAQTFNQLSSIPTSTLTPGEKLTLRFYPSLTLASMPTAPTSGTPYGEVRSDSIEFGASGGVPGETGWFVPSAGATVNLEYVTVSNSGTYSNMSAYASNVVVSVPEPSTTGIIGGLVIGFMGLIKVRRSLA